jgi:two-component system alkaline phosphatase synthesis response regulator PhoP
MKRTILVIDDELDFLNSIREFLENDQFEVICFQSGEDLFQTQQTPQHCLYLVDWNLPGINGCEIIKKIRRRDKISPIFIISGNNKHEQILEGLKSGADDYITKPFSFEELGVKISNAFEKMMILHENLINVGLKLIPEANAVIKDGVTVHFTAREFVIFNHLYENKSVVTRDELINQFHKDLKMTARNIDVHVFSLRKKISKINLVIETVWGTGYKLNI